MSDKLTETVTVTREVPMAIADLVIFARSVQDHARNLTDAELIAEARSFWDMRHGED